MCAIKNTDNEIVWDYVGLHKEYGNWVGTVTFKIPPSGGTFNRVGLFSVDKWYWSEIVAQTFSKRLTRKYWWQFWRESLKVFNLQEPSTYTVTFTVTDGLVQAIRDDDVSDKAILLLSNIKEITSSLK